MGGAPSAAEVVNPKFCGGMRQSRGKNFEFPWRRSDSVEDDQNVPKKFRARNDLIAAKLSLASMSNDRSERQIAQELIEQHGDDAAFVAARRAEALRGAGGEEF